MNKMPKGRSNILSIILAIVLIFGVYSFINPTEPATKPTSYSTFVTALNQNNVDTITMQPDENSPTTTVKWKEKNNKSQTNVTVIKENDQDIAKLIANKAVTVDVEVKQTEKTSVWLSLASGIIPFILMMGFLFFILSQQSGGGGKLMSFGKSKAKLINKDKKSVRFRDVAGADEEKQELVEVVDFLKDHSKFTAMGARIPKGVLLVGPPGTGKTLLARAVAGESGVPFFSISGSDFVEMFVGVGASRVRDLFEQAKKNAPCIIFIDEIDAVGRQRGTGVGGGHDEREQTLNQLLVEMDGFDGDKGIIVIAATNRADVLDQALLRPGRFDRQIRVGLPDVKGREAVLKVHARKKPLDSSVDLEAMAERTPGFSGADLENLLNEAALLAARENKTKIDMRDLDEAMDRVIAGPAKKSKVISKKERDIVAWHEAGHTVIGMALDNAEKVHKVTIIPRGEAGGYAVMLPKEDRYFMTKPELLDKITGLLGGRVAEDITFGEVSTGAHNDFQRATQIARAMVTEYGMSDKIGPAQFPSSNGGNPFLGRELANGSHYSEAITKEIDFEVQDILKQCYERAKEILLAHQEQLNLIATSLLELETLDSKQINSLFYDGKLEERKYGTDETNNEIDVTSAEDKEI